MLSSRLLCIGTMFFASVLSQADSLLIRLTPSRTTDLWISSSNPDTNFDEGELRIGGNTDWDYSLIKFDLESLPKVAKSVLLSFYVLDSGDNSTQPLLDFYEITSPWGRETTWNNQPSTFFISGGWSPLRPRGGVGIDIGSTYNAWQRGELPNYGFEFRSRTNNNEATCFASSDHSTYYPLLIIVYNQADQFLHLGFPLGGSPFSRLVSAVMDHDRTLGIVETYNGEIGSINSYIWSTTVVGYQKINNQDFEIPLIGGYRDQVSGGNEKQVIFYDNHNGYDYPAFEEKEIIYAPADGVMAVATTQTKPDGVNYWRDKKKCPTIGGKNTLTWDQFHTFYIIHGDTGYSSWFLHADRLMARVKKEIIRNGYAVVYRGRPIARVGDKGVKGSPHLHFGLRYGDKLIDPYSAVLWDDQP